MKKTDVFGFSCLSLFMLCCSSLDESYRGYLLYENKPLIRAKVLEEGTDNYTYTDKEGFFKLERSNEGLVGSLIIYTNKGNFMDTIELVVRSGVGGRPYFLFLSKNKDSLDLRTERFFNAKSENSKFDYQYYSGYIMYNKKAMYNAKVIEGSTGKQTLTNKSGFFYLKRSDLNFVDKLIIQADGSADKDTLELLRKGSDGKPYSLFFKQEQDSIGYQYKFDLYEERKAK